MRVDEELRRQHLQVMIDMGRLHRFLVIGRGKSGTTWLGRILNSHPSVFLRGERKLVEKTAPYTPILRHLLNDRVMGVWGQHTSFRLGLQPERMGPALWRLVDDYLLAASLVSLKVDVASLTHLGDKLALLRGRDVQDILPNLDLAYPGYRAIHIVRDGRDVALSMFGRRHDFRAYNTYYAARQWEQYVEAGREHGRGLSPSQFLELRYEDMIGDQKAALRRICAFLDEPYSDDLLEYRKPQGPGKTPLLQKPIQASNKDKWKKEMSPRQIRVFESAAAESLRKFGYSLTTDGTRLPLALRAAYRWHNALNTHWYRAFGPKKRAWVRPS